MKQVFRYMHRINNLPGAPSRHGGRKLPAEKFATADEAWTAARKVGLHREPWVFEEQDVLEASGACRESRSVSGDLARPCDCLCCRAAVLLDAEAEQARQADRELLGGITHDQLMALEAFGMVRRVSGAEQGPAVYEITHDGRVLLENCIESRR